LYDGRRDWSVRRSTWLLLGVPVLVSSEERGRNLWEILRNNSPKIRSSVEQEKWRCKMYELCHKSQKKPIAIELPKFFTC
jgi:hypothetical protein